MEWKKLIFDDKGHWSHPDLEDYYFYLVAHKKFATPMKAMYHDECYGCRFEIVSGSWRTGEIKDVFSWDDDITHFMDLPEMPEADFKYGDDKFWNSDVDSGEESQK